MCGKKDGGWKVIQAIPERQHYFMDFFSIFCCPLNFLLCSERKCQSGNWSSSLPPFPFIIILKKARFHCSTLCHVFGTQWNICGLRSVQKVQSAFSIQLFVGKHCISVEGELLQTLALGTTSGWMFSLFPTSKAASSTYSSKLWSTERVSWEFIQLWSTERVPWEAYSSTEQEWHIHP